MATLGFKSRHLLKNNVNDGSNGIFGNNPLGVTLVTDPEIIETFRAMLDIDGPMKNYIQIVPLYQMETDGEGTYDATSTIVEYMVVYSPGALGLEVPWDDYLEWQASLGGGGTIDPNQPGGGPGQS